MLVVIESYDKRNSDLEALLQGNSIQYLSMTYQGELPTGVLCPFQYYCNINLNGRARFFNEIEVPDGCEIRQDNHPYGEVRKDGFPLARIFYWPNSFRRVKAVDWLNRDLSISYTEHYDCYGTQYAKTYYLHGHVYQTAYYNKHHEVIQVNHITKYVMLQDNNKRYLFPSIVEFNSHYLDELGLTDQPYIINSLSYPLFLCRFRAKEANTTLLWQERFVDGIPGNMIVELEQPKAIHTIIMEDKEEYEQILSRYPSTSIKVKLGIESLHT